jgi:hypothetical protein
MKIKCAWSTGSATGGNDSRAALVANVLADPIVFDDRMALPSEAAREYSGLFLGVELDGFAQWRASDGFRFNTIQPPHPPGDALLCAGGARLAPRLRFFRVSDFPRRGPDRRGARLPTRSTMLRFRPADHLVWPG